MINEQAIAERLASRSIVSIPASEREAYASTADNLTREFLSRKGNLAIRHIKDALQSLGFLRNYFDMEIREGNLGSQKFRMNTN